jgi:hypothetical protein
MYRRLIFSLCLVLLSITTVVAEDNGPNEPNGANGPNEADVSNGSGESDAKTLRGMSVLGNNEAPMSLFIVPWKSSELGAEANLTRTLNERDVPVDREVFMRELSFYQVSVDGKASVPVGVSQNSK